MSSEVEEKQELTQEALDAANTEEKPPAEEEPTVPLHVHTALRSRAQTAEVAQARAEGKLEALQGQNIKTATVSPLDAAKTAYIEENGDLEGFSFSVELYESQEAYKAHQATEAVKSDAAFTLANEQAVSVRSIRLVHDDYDAVINEGEALLTKGEHLDVISTGAKFGTFSYAKCKAAIERAKPVEKTEAAPKTELSKLEAEAKVKAEAEAKVKADAEKVPSQDEVLKSDNPRIGHVMNL